MAMRNLIVYESIHHGNTEKIGKAMAECLNAELIKSDDVNVNNLMDYDLIGFGSGIYYGKFHKNILDLIDKLPNLANKKAFVFSTSGQGKIEYNNPIEQKLKEKDYKVIGSFACKGYDTFGPLKLIGGISKDRPNNNDIQKAKEFAEKL
jgi:flavodoxin